MGAWAIAALSLTALVIPAEAVAFRVHRVALPHDIVRPSSLVIRARLKLRCLDVVPLIRDVWHRVGRSAKEQSSHEQKR